jgi:hypothetical protein
MFFTYLLANYYYFRVFGYANLFKLASLLKLTKTASTDRMHRAAARVD